MLLKNKSIEELLDLEEELLEAKDAEKEGTFSKLISVYEALYRSISKEPSSEYAFSLEKVKKQLIFYLIKYGTYLKTVYQKDDYAAENCLKKAVRYEKQLPIAYYRLGFLHYKKKSYSSALNYFQKAIHYQKNNENTEYRMNKQQLYHCHLYLANCGLFIAQKAQEELETLETSVKRQEVPNYQTSPLFDLIKANDQYLEHHAFQLVTQGNNQYCTKEECEEKGEAKHTIILDFTGRDHLLIFNGKECRLTKNQAEMLRYFLLYSNENHQVTKHDVYDLFSKSDENGEIPTNTFTQNVIRLRAKLKQVDINTPVIENRLGMSETAYYYNQLVPYLIMHRSDDSFIL
ncbi:hypothetical protein [Alkalihalobacterium sp. APHAB7]|uniref:hypothetical protein n=1 Tax=Alkalihalobacterium sp. APHAB7 TaxID=3402081 RepID=UPI003AAD5744